MLFKNKTSTGNPPPLSRLMLWEIMGLVGFLHILYYAPAQDPVPLIFLCNGAIFLALYPVLYFYDHLLVPTFLKFMISPLHAFLQVVLLITTYIWTIYVLYAVQFQLNHVFVFEVFTNYYWVLFPVFMLVYFFFFLHMLGVGGENHSFWSSAAILSDGVSGVVLGYGLGKTLDTKWGMFFGSNPTRVLFWMLFLLIGVIVVVWFNARTRKG
jgi:hypothetical protein